MDRLSTKERIVQQYGEHFLKRSALRIPGAETFQRLLEGKGYRTVLEIGTYRGCSALEISQYCERVVTVDLLRGELERDGVSFHREEFWNAMGARNIELRLVADDQDKAKLIAQLDFDFAFVDGAHDVASVRRDFIMVKRCGRVLFHDYGRASIVEFVGTLPKEQVQVMGVFAFWERK